MSPMAYIRKPPGIEDFSDRKYQNRRQISRLASVAIDYFKQSVKKIEAPVNVSDGVYPQTARDRRLFCTTPHLLPRQIAPKKTRQQKQILTGTFARTPRSTSESESLSEEHFS